MTPSPGQYWIKFKQPLPSVVEIMEVLGPEVVVRTGIDRCARMEITVLVGQGFQPYTIDFSIDIPDQAWDDPFTTEEDL